MNKLIQRLLGHTERPSRPAHSRPASIDNPPTITDGSENATRRQLVQVLLRDLLRRSGIPPQWLECQMLVVSSRSKGAGIHVRIVAKHWDARLMNYASAFQNELMTDILRFDPLAAVWLNGISWQLDMADNCPYDALPDKTFWAEAETPPVQSPALQAQAVHAVQATAPVEVPLLDANDPQDDLEKLFAIRDRELDREAAQGLMPVGYEKTQPSPLQA